jgi:exonuclease III
LKICSYNLRYGGHTNPGNPWQRLHEEFSPDIVCAQESLPPGRYFPPEEIAGMRGCVHANVEHGKWGSAILSRSYAMTPLALPGFGGWVVGARIDGALINGVAQSITIYSVHAPSPGPYAPHVGRILDAVASTIDDGPLVLAGDFNLTTALRHRSEPLLNTRGERVLLERLRREFGLFNAGQILHPNESLPQTLRWSRNPKPHYHCDAIFLSHHLLPHLISAEVIASGEWGEMSDHNLLAVELA